MKKAVSCTLLVCLAIICLMMQPFLIYAENTPIDGFDYTNYDQLDYISNTLGNNNGAYIDIGLLASQVDEVTVSYRYSGGSRIFGTKTGYYWGMDTSIMRSKPEQKQFSASMSAGTDYVIVATKTSLTVNGNNVNGTNNTTSGSDENLCVFKYHSNAYDTDARLYYFFAKTNGSYVRKMYPAKRKADDVVGLYDTVNNTFYINASSQGSFTYGSVITVTQPVTQYTITTSVSPSGSGTVSGGGTYDSGSSVTLTATASSGFSFSEWSDGNTSNPRNISVNENATYTAYFIEQTSPVQTFTISTAVSPSGGGSVSGGGTYDEGTSVVLAATASTGYSFVKWSDDVTTNPRTITVSSNLSLTAIFEQNQAEPDAPTPPAGWTDWTDEDDSEYLDQIQDIDLSKLYWSINLERVVDFVQIYQTQMNVNSGYNGSLNVSFTGSYYDNTITGLQACNSTSYNYSTSSSNQVDVLTIEPAIYGSFDAPTIGQDGTVFNFGISVNGGSSSNVTTSTNGFSNTTEACRLIGMATGDGSIDGTTLLAAGYQKKTITYNDGSASGHTATFYVPGNEEIDIGADFSFIDDLLESLYIQIVNNTKVIAHDEYTLRFHAKDGEILPKYGHVHSDSFIGVLFSGLDWTPNSVFLNKIDDKFYLVSQPDVYASFNNTFNYHLTDNIYDRNYLDLYWMDIRNPVWKFKTNSIDWSLLNGTFRPAYNYFNDYGGAIYSLAEAYTIQSLDLSIDSNLTAGAVLKVGLSSVNLYNYKNNSLLNRFNQLGSMMYGWFNRIYQAIGNITGGNESNEIINNVVEDYDIDVEINFNGLLSDVFTKKQDIDLNDPEYVVPSVDHSAIHSLAEAMERIYDEVYIQNGIGIVIFAPLILLVLRLIL